MAADDEKKTRRSRSSGAEEAARVAREASDALAQQAEEQTDATADLAAEELEAGREITETAVDLGTQAMETAESWRASAEEQQGMATDAATRVYNEMMGAGGEDLRAMMQSSTRVMQGMQEIGRHLAGMAQNSLQLSIRAANDMMLARDWDEIAAIQRNYVQGSLDCVVSESTEVLRASMALATESLMPLQSRAASDLLRGSQLVDQQINDAPIPRIGPRRGGSGQERQQRA